MSPPQPELSRGFEYRNAEEYRAAAAYDDQLRANNGVAPRVGPLFPALRRRRGSGRAPNKRQVNRVDFVMYDDDDSAPSARDFHYRLDETGQSSTHHLSSGRPTKRRRHRLQDLEGDFTGLDFGPAVDNGSDPRTAPLQEHGRPFEFLDGAGELQDGVVDMEGGEEGGLGTGKRYRSSVSEISAGGLPQLMKFYRMTLCQSGGSGRMNSWTRLCAGRDSGKLSIDRGVPLAERFSRTIGSTKSGALYRLRGQRCPTCQRHPSHWLLRRMGSWTPTFACPKNLPWTKRNPPPPRPLIHSTVVEDVVNGRSVWAAAWNGTEDRLCIE